MKTNGNHEPLHWLMYLSGAIHLDTAHLFSSFAELGSQKVHSRASQNSAMNILTVPNNHHCYIGSQIAELELEIQHANVRDESPVQF